MWFGKLILAFVFATGTLLTAFARVSNMARPVFLLIENPHD